MPSDETMLRNALAAISLAARESTSSDSEKVATMARLARAAIDSMSLHPARPDGMPASSDERKLRRMLAVQVGGLALYLDDGEASMIERGLFIDFMRDAPSVIERKLLSLRIARARADDGPLTIYCPERRRTGVCQRPNVHCGWPQCNEPPHGGRT